jgi:hypothetical protein
VLPVTKQSLRGTYVDVAVYSCYIGTPFIFGYYNYVMDAVDHNLQHIVNALQQHQHQHRRETKQEDASVDGNAIVASDCTV